METKRCPECEKPNQFGQLCNSCYRDEQQSAVDKEAGY